MRPTRPLPRLAAAAATGAVLVLAASASAMAQGDQPPRPAHIHDGSCPTPGDVVHPLHDVSAEALVDGEPSAGDVAGDPSDDPADQVLVSMTTVDATVEELTSGEFAINVHESADLIDVFIACGDVAGTLLLVPDDTGDAPDATDDPDDADEAEGDDVDTALAIRLREQSDSGISGIAWLREADDGARTVVHLFLFQEPVAEAIPPASPPADSPPATNAPAESPAAESPAAESPASTDGSPAPTSVASPPPAGSPAPPIESPAPPAETVAPPPAESPAPASPAA